MDLIMCFAATWLLGALAGWRAQRIHMKWQLLKALRKFRDS